MKNKYGLMVREFVDIVLKCALIVMWGWWCYILLTETFWLAFFLIFLLTPFTWLFVIIIALINKNKPENKNV